MTSILKRILFLLLIFASCFGCKKDSLKDADLLKTTWILSYIQDTKTHTVTNYPSDATKRISIVFNDSPDIISFNGICNGGEGTFTYSSVTGEIKVTDLGTTLIWCKYVEWETYTVQNLNYASSYKIDGNDLVIYSNGSYNLYFTKN
jgi:heat shock protein HslJ